MNTLVTTIITTLIAGLTSGGFLGFILKIIQRKDTSSQMLLGLGHHEILEIGVMQVLSIPFLFLCLLI